MKHRLLMTAIFVASLALSTAANANLITYNFETTVNDTTSDFFGTVGTGSLIFDDSILDLDGYGYFAPIDNVPFDFSFNIFGQTFVSNNDSEFPYYPEFEIIDSKLDYMAFFVSETGPNVTQINQAGIDAFGFGIDGYGDYFTLDNNGVYQGELYVEGIVVSAVPVPAAAWLFGTGLMGLVGFGRRKNKQS